MINRWRVFMGFIAGLLFALMSHAASTGRLLLGLGIALAGLLLRGWAAGYLEKGKRLAQDGPYAIFRHPLYAGSFILALGFCIAGTGSTRWIHSYLLWFVFLFLFVLIYPRRIADEEKSLETYFGDAWRDFAGRGHRFLPALRPRRRDNPDRFSWGRYVKNKEYKAALGWLAGAILLSIKAVNNW